MPFVMNDAVSHDAFNTNRTCVNHMVSSTCLEKYTSLSALCPAFKITDDNALVNDETPEIDLNKLDGNALVTAQASFTEGGAPVTIAPKLSNIVELKASGAILSVEDAEEIKAVLAV